MTLTKQDLRTLLTILMYAGIAVFLVPFLFGRSQGAHGLEAGGALAAIVFGLSRCLFTEEDCWWTYSTLQATPSKTYRAEPPETT